MERYNMGLEIGRYIQATRKRHNVSAAALAAALKVPDSYLTKWELDNSFPNLDALNAIAAVIGCDARELLGMKEKRGADWRHPFAKKDAIHWNVQGNVHRQEVLGILVQMVADMTPDDAPVRKAMDKYYSLLMTGKGTTVDFIIDTQNSELATVMAQTGRHLSPANQSRYQQLVKISRERFGVR
jgi:transcriptional regulator with XRE-family HTH domain